MVVLKNDPALLNQPMALYTANVNICREIPDVCLVGSQGELILDPPIRILSCQNPIFPDHIKHPVCPDSQIAQIPVCKCALWRLRTFVHAYISVTAWIMLAYIQLLSMRICAVYISCIAQNCSAAAVRTSDRFFLWFQTNHPLKQKRHAHTCMCSCILITTIFYSKSSVLRVFFKKFLHKFVPKWYQSPIFKQM